MNDYVINLRLFALGAVLLLSGCETIGPTVARDSESADMQVTAIEEGVATNERLAAESRAVSRAMLDALTPEPDAEELDADLRFDLAVNGILSQEFFRGLVRDTPYNMVVHPDVNGQVNLDLKDVTVAEVMEIMRDVYSYDYERKGNLYRLYPNVLRTEIFQIDYLNVERKGSSEMQVSAGRVTDSRGSGSSDEGTSGLSASGVYSTGTNRGGTVVGTKVNTDAETNFWAELQSTLQTIIAGDEGSQIVVTPQVGLAVVRAKPDSLFAVRSYLSQVENTLHRQVIIEAKILEVTLREGFEAGIDWNNFGEESGGSFYPSTIVDADGNTVVLPGSSRDVGAELVPGEAEFFNPLGSAFTFYASFSDFEITIDLLETQGSVQVLSSPRISTVNNQKAVIKVGEDEFFVTDISSNTITAGSSINTNDSPELTPFFSGIALDVTPQISDMGDVILHIHPTISEVKEQQKNIAGKIIPLAMSTIRESDSIVRAKNGQIIVIGGLMQNVAVDNGAGVPFFKNIPGVGNLFKQKAMSSTKSELVILLKPMIVDEKVQVEALNDSLKNLKTLRSVLNSNG